MQRAIQTAHEITQILITSLFRVSGKVHKIFLDKDYESLSKRRLSWIILYHLEYQGSVKAPQKE